jgi:hypothetical protein
MRAISFNKVADGVKRKEALQFIGQSCFKAGNSECISALTDLALARRLGLLGQPAPPSMSAEMYSQIARESQTVISLCNKTGTFSEGE